MLPFVGRYGSPLDAVQTVLSSRRRPGVSNQNDLGEGIAGFQGWEPPEISVDGPQLLDTVSLA